MNTLYVVYTQNVIDELIGLQRTEFLFTTCYYLFWTQLNLTLDLLSLLSL